MSDLTPIQTVSAAPVTGSAILTAISKAMGEMKRLAKDNKNTEQKYEFASVDDFLAMTGPVCAANGIITLMDEVSVDNFEKAGKYGPTHWARYVFAITTYHASGEALPTVRRSVEVIRSGAQAAGSAQSYALKQYQRALYQIPTGDKDDPDHGSPVEQAPPRQEQRQPPRDPGPTAADMAIKALSGADTLDRLAAIWGDLPRAVQGHQLVIDAKDAAKARLSQSANETTNNEGAQ
ncbi:ERF family protein [Falsigemmobacter intermedius]|uniref:ERF family protein n=1 Tax=Falsigemmobacter intermedius TaxID=1553448 RepID=A0A3S3U6V9_9RHOB|nr:ERF family protein [Falsigemmobacter intermedius]RWY38508.1 hypothetical protein EP867_15985 [Falsigemmobacter intermedius]